MKTKVYCPKSREKWVSKLVKRHLGVVVVIVVIIIVVVVVVVDVVVVVMVVVVAHTKIKAPSPARLVIS